MAAHISPDKFVGQIGSPSADHAYWGRPEQQSGDRPCYVWDSSKPASDLLSAASSALSAGALALKPVDPSYADQLVSQAKELYAMATKTEGKYSSSYSDATYVYNSYTYRDDLALAAALLWKATGDQSYLADAKAQRAKPDFLIESYVNWDAVGPLSAIILECGGQGTEESGRHVEKFLSEWQNCKGGGFQKTPQGLCIPPLGGWGNLRHATSAAFAMLIHAKCEDDPAKKSRSVSFAKSQVDYALGSTGRSFVVGFGDNYPKKAHHRGASCPDQPAACDRNAYNNAGPNPQVLYGALVGGPPGPGDDYVDDRQNYQTNEVAVDYNAGFTGALAGLISLEGGGGSTPVPTPANPINVPTPVSPDNCDDIPPADSTYTCAQQAEWGKCNESWMQGTVCRKSCNRC